VNHALVDINLLVVVLAAISVGALLKGMTGLGLPLFAVPAVATITSVEEAVVLMIIPGIAANAWLAISHRQYRTLLGEHIPFLVGGFFGGIAGTALLLVVSDRALKVLLAIWLALYLIQYVLANNSLDVFRGKGRIAYVLGFAGGTIQGATGISAQIVAPYYHGRSLAPAAYAFLVTFTFLLFASAQSAAAVGTGLLTAQRLQLSLIALVPTLIFTRIGIAYAGAISHEAFNKILLVTFFFFLLKLIADVL